MEATLALSRLWVFGHCFQVIVEPIRCGGCACVSFDTMHDDPAIVGGLGEPVADYPMKRAVPTRCPVPPASRRENTSGSNRMNAADTLTIANNLEAAGVERRQAEALAKAMHETASASRSELATKADLAGLESRLVKWGVALAGAVVVILGLIIRWP